MSVPTQTIQTILETQLLTVVSVSDLQKENTVRVAKSLNFVRATLLPAQTRIGSLGTTGYDILSGLFQVDVFTKIGVGTDGGNTIADDIMDAFIKGTLLTSGTTEVLIENKWRIPGRVLQNYYQIPVMVQYTVYSK